MPRKVLTLVLLIALVGAFTWKHTVTAPSATSSRLIADDLPPSATSAANQLASSPRHREYVSIATPGVPGDSIRAWVFYPQTNHKAPVVVVIHEIFGMSTWIKAVGDQVAADGYIAIVPDLIHRSLPPQAPDTMIPDEGVRAVRALQPADVQRDLDAAAAYATHLPSALPVYATIGFCWGGGTSFAHNVHVPATGGPTLKATVVYYGPTPDTSQLPNSRAPVLGLYAGNDARISSTVPATDSAMQRDHKTYVDKIYDGAGHGFLRAQDGENGANASATKDAWPRTLVWLHKYLGA